MSSILALSAKIPHFDVIKKIWLNNGCIVTWWNNTLLQADEVRNEHFIEPTIFQIRKNLNLLLENLNLFNRE